MLGYFDDEEGLKDRLESREVVIIECYIVYEYLLATNARSGGDLSDNVVIFDDYNNHPYW